MNPHKACFYLLCMLAQCAVSGTICSGPSVEQIHLSLVDETNVCVMWNSSQAISTPTVRYVKGTCTEGAAGNSWSSSPGTPVPYYSKTAGVIYSAILGGLQADSTYCYAIGEPCEHESRWQFMTSSPHKGIVAALSDAGTLGNVTYVMDNLAADKDVTLVLHPGDLSYGLTEEVWDRFGRIVEPVAREKPYMIVPGNWDVKDDAIKSFVNRYTMPLVSQPSQPAVLPLSYYYSFNYSLFHFVMLSSYDPYNSTSAQYKWLERDLEAASQDRVTHPWIIVSVHSPMYSSNAGHQGGDTPFRLAVEPLLVKYGVDVVLTGHDHGYERTYPVIDNVVYDSGGPVYHFPRAPIHILVGTAGASLDEWLAQPTWSAHREASFGYTKLEATPHILRVVYTRQNLIIGDQFQINKVAQLNMQYVVLVGLVIVFAVLPLLLYKGLPDPIRNYLFCRVVEDEMPHVYKFI